MPRAMTADLSRRAVLRVANNLLDGCTPAKALELTAAGLRLPVSTLTRLCEAHGFPNAVAMRANLMYANPKPERVVDDRPDPLELAAYQERSELNAMERAILAEIEVRRAEQRLKQAKAEFRIASRRIGPQVRAWAKSEGLPHTKTTPSIVMTSRFLAATTGSSGA